MQTPNACIFMAYPLVKFGADSFTIKEDTERDKQTEGDSYIALLTGLRPVELISSLPVHPPLYHILSSNDMYSLFLHF